MATPSSCPMRRATWSPVRVPTASFMPICDSSPPGGCGSTASQVTLSYTRDTFRRDTVIEFNENFSVGLERAHYELHLEPRGSWRTCIDVIPVGDGELNRLEHGDRTFGDPKPDMPTSFEQWM